MDIPTVEKEDTDPGEYLDWGNIPENNDSDEWGQWDNETGGWDVEENTGIQSVSQEMFIHPLIKAVQELSAKVDELESKLNGE